MDPNAYNPNPGLNGQNGQNPGNPGVPGQNPGPQPPYGQQSPYGQNYPQQQGGQYPPAQQQPYPPAPINPQTGYQPLEPLQPNPYSGYNPDPYPGETEEKTKSNGPNKMIFVVIAVIVVLAVGVAVIIAAMNNKSPSAPTNNTPKTATSDAGADVVPRNDGQLDLSVKVDTTTSIKEQTVKAKTKEQINLSSGFSFMATKIEAFTPSDPTVKPGAGKQFVVVSVAVGNRAQSNTTSVSYLDFKLRDNDNNLLAGHASTQAILGNTLANPTSLKPGEQVTGKIVFEVDATDTSWVLVHKENYQKTTDNTTFSVEGDAVVSTTPAATTTPAPPTPPATSP
jgi:flagellar basal body-associated protein FliL